MAGLLEALARRVVRNRRQSRRVHHQYDAVMRDVHGHKIFTGRSLDISTGGARMRGVPFNTGVFKRQAVHIEFLLVPKTASEAAQWVRLSAHVRRVTANDDGRVTVGVQFDQPLPKPL